MDVVIHKKYVCFVFFLKSKIFYFVGKSETGDNAPGRVPTGTGKPGKMGRHFSSQGKVREF